MTRKSLQQYLELLESSGIDELYLPEYDIDSREKAEKLANKQENYRNCQKCSLHKNRINFVYGTGNPDARLMLIGEGPGSEENKQGKPFVGKAGQLLTKMLLAINLQRSEVYITNVVKCQPPGNRNPAPDEVEQCLPYLREQIEIISPKLIVLLGKVAAVTLFDVKEPMTILRQRRFNYEGIETYVTYHPAALIYNASLKKESWKDLQKIRDIYNSIEKQS